MGCGRMGVSAAAALVQEGYELRVMDIDVSAFALLPQGLVEEGRVSPIVADGTLESGLREASVPDAELFVAVTGSDAANALAAQIARHLLGVANVVCRIDDPARKEMYEQLGLTVVCATELVTEAIVGSAAGVAR